MGKDTLTAISPVESLERSPLQNDSLFRRVFHGTLVQVLIVGLVSCMNPGIWNALNSESPRLRSRHQWPNSLFIQVLVPEVKSRRSLSMLRMPLPLGK
jgi:hypothetical protein